MTCLMILRNIFISEKTDKWIIYSFVSKNEQMHFVFFILAVLWSRKYVIAILLGFKFSVENPKVYSEKVLKSLLFMLLTWLFWRLYWNGHRKDSTLTEIQTIGLF